MFFILFFCVISYFNYNGNITSDVVFRWHEYCGDELYYN